MGGGQAPWSQLSNRVFFLKREKDAECSETEKNDFVIKNILSKTHVLDHSGSFDMHICKKT